METPLAKGLRAALEATDEEFRRVKKSQGRRIRCREGCDDCCSRLFQISEAEAAEVSRAVEALPAEARAATLRRAERYLETRGEMLRRTGYVESWGALPRPEARLPCPLLDDGRCLIHANRPRSCRLYGAPLHHPRMPHRIFACEHNFAPGEAIEEPRLVSIQTTLAEDWTALQEAYDRAGGRRFDEPVTVAHAVLHDFSGYPPE